MERDGSKFYRNISGCLGGRSVAQAAELAPAWVPDTETTHCMHCKKTVFGFVNRRHHCRKCGIVACNGCTTKRFLLPNQSRYLLFLVLNAYLSGYDLVESYDSVFDLSY